MSIAPSSNANHRQAAAAEVVRCNFRSAGRLSNESTRHLRLMHDAFARHISHALDLFLGSPCEIKLTGVEQIGSREFTASLTPGAYLVPYTLVPAQTRVLIKFDQALLFPLLDVLLGGPGEPLDTVREMTDIDEELISSITEMIGTQLERTWKSSGVSVIASPSVRPALVGQLFLAEERVISLQFEVALGVTRASMRIILPVAFCNALVRASQSESVHPIPGDRKPSLPLEQRLLDCSMLVSADLPLVTMPVGELIDLRQGEVISFRVPVDTPVQLRVEDYALFELVPVRSARRKAAQLTRTCHDLL